MYYCNKCKGHHSSYIVDDIKWECHYSFNDVRKIKQEHLLKRYEEMQKEYVIRLIKNGEYNEI